MSPTNGHVIFRRQRRGFPIAIIGQVLTDKKPDLGVCAKPLQRHLHGGRPWNLLFLLALNLPLKPRRSQVVGLDLSDPLLIEIPGLKVYV